MTDKADRGLVRAEEAGAAFPKKEAEKQPQPPALPHSAQRRAGADPWGRMSLLGAWPEGPGPTVCYQPGLAWGVWRRGLGRGCPDPPTQPHSLRA